MLTYCTNVHAGRTLAETEANLDRFAPRVRELTATSEDPEAPIGLGLWLSASAARELRENNGASALRDRLLAKGLHVLTFNGFPFGDFHAEVVKHAVYEPHWADPKRLAYTIDLANLLVDLLPDGTAEASISTLPIGWRTSFTNEGGGCSVGMAAAQLVEAAKALRTIEERTGVEAARLELYGGERAGGEALAENQLSDDELLAEIAAPEASLEQSALLWMVVRSAFFLILLS